MENDHTFIAPPEIEKYSYFIVFLSCFLLQTNNIEDYRYVLILTRIKVDKDETTKKSNFLC